jgi:hypothetical protein
MTFDMMTIIAVISFTMLRLAIPVLAVWLLSKALRFGLAVLP